MEFEYLARQEIMHQLSISERLEQNGVAERMNMISCSEYQVTGWYARGLMGRGSKPCGLEQNGVTERMNMISCSEYQVTCWHARGLMGRGSKSCGLSHQQSPSVAIDH